MNSNTDIKDILCGEVKIVPPSEEVYRQVRKGWDRVAKPLDGLGKLEDVTARIGAACGESSLLLERRAILVFCADNGIVEEGVSQSGQDVTLAVEKSMGRQRSSVCRMGKAAGAEVIPVDIGVNSKEVIDGVLNRKVAFGTRNFAREAAMSEEEVISALRTGFDLASEMKEKRVKILGVGEMGIGNTTTSSAITAALTGKRAEEITGRGAGLDDEGLSRKIRVIDEAIKKYDLYSADAFTVLKSVGGLDIAGICGCMIGAALNSIPVVLDGAITFSAALAAVRMVPEVRGYLIPSHIGKEPACKVIAKELEFDAPIYADLALGEGCGSALLFALLDNILPLYREQTTFDEIEIDAYTRKGDANGEQPC